MTSGGNTTNRAPPTRGYGEREGGRGGGEGGGGAVIFWNFDSSKLVDSGSSKLIDSGSSKLVDFASLKLVEFHYS